MTIRQQIAEGHLNDALVSLGELHYDGILIRANYNTAKKQFQMGMIPSSEWTLAQSKANYAALELCDFLRLPKLQEMVTISLNMTSGSFRDAIQSLSIDQVKDQCLKAFKDSPAMLDAVLDAVHPIERAQSTNRPIEVGAVAKAKDDLVNMFVEHIEKARILKDRERVADLKAIVANLEDVVDEETVLHCFDLLEVFFVSNTGYVGLNEVRSRRSRLQSGEDEAVLRRMGRLQHRVDEERTWIVQVTNRLIENLEK